MTRNVFVTGGTRGIGRAVVERFAKMDCQVFYTYHKSERASSEIDEAYPNARGFRCDTRDHVDCEALAAMLKETEGGIDILINNVGITEDKTFAKMTYAQWENVLTVNLLGLFGFTHAFYPGMCERGWGRIINMASVIGQKGGFGQTNYAASKAGVIGFTKALALECAKKGVTVNAVSPGFVETAMTEQMPEKVLEDIRKSIPQQRLAHKDEIARTILFLASEESQYITGQVICVNGGLY